MILNGNQWGTGPQPAEFYEKFPGSLDLLDLFTKFREKVLPLKNHTKVTVKLLDWGSVEMVFTRENDRLSISEKYIDAGTVISTKPFEYGKILWTGEVSFREFCDVCAANIKEFQAEVIKRNSLLSDNIYIKRLNIDDRSF